MKLNFVTEEELADYIPDEEFVEAFTDNPYGVSMLYTSIAYVCLDRAEFTQLCKHLSTAKELDDDNFVASTLGGLVKYGLTPEQRKFVYEMLEQANKFKTYKNRGSAIFKFKMNDILAILSRHMSINTEKLASIMSLVID